MGKSKHRIVSKESRSSESKQASDKTTTTEQGNNVMIKENTREFSVAKEHRRYGGGKEGLLSIFMTRCSRRLNDTLDLFSAILEQ